MLQMTKEEITKLVTDISEKEFKKEIDYMPNDLEELFKEKQDYYSLMAGMFPFMMGYNYRICRNTIIEVINKLMNE